MKKPVLISGVQPTGKLHIGNYLGAIKNFVDLQNSGKYECYFFIADLHSLTKEFSKSELEGNIRDVVLSYFAAGLNPQKSVIFFQSQIPAHAELTWVLNAITPFGELRRMTQFKDKSEHQPQNINVGLFDYPVLMAADILLYDAKFVPVGEDQLQHLELARTLVRKFNAKFGKTFVEPKPILTEIPRLISLDDPTKKMSKSRPAGCLFLDDSPEVMREKVKSAVTDSGKDVKYNEKNKPAISNLMKIYETFSGEPPKSIEEKFKGKGYGLFKTDLAEVIIKGLAPFQKKKQELQKNPDKIKNILQEGGEYAAAVASKKLKEVKKKIGLIL